MKQEAAQIIVQSTPIIANNVPGKGMSSSKQYALAKNIIKPNIKIIYSTTSYKRVKTKLEAAR